MCRAVISAFVNWSKPAQPRRLNKRKRVQSPHLLQSNYRKINASRKYWKSWNIINKKSITDQRDLGFFVVSRYAYKIHTQFHFTFTIQFIRLRCVFFVHFVCRSMLWSDQKNYWSDRWLRWLHCRDNYCCRRTLCKCMQCIDIWLLRWLPLWMAID